jgi:hypothetical protein
MPGVTFAQRAAFTRILRGYNPRALGSARGGDGTAFVPHAGKA